MKNLLKDIRTMTKIELENFFFEHGAPKFRATQVYEWLWKHYKMNFNEMTNLSLKERKMLNQHFVIHPIGIRKETISTDGTIKFLFQLKDKGVVEGVLIPQLNRLTACISSQSGCSLACKFCATGKLKFGRNLSAAEIYDQAYLINQHCINKFNKPITNIVFMGMGEPLLNFKNVLRGIHHITSKFGMGMSGKRITVSTVGITKIIRKVADMKPNFNLAISLHAANNLKRSQIMEINKTNSLSNLLESLQYFYMKTKIKPTYEYILLKGFNDSIQDADELSDFCSKVPSKVNLIEYNKVEGNAFEKSTPQSTNLFMKTLEKKGILVKLRRSRGEDIGAACGQLATQQQ